jgi:hypothetical protein
MFFLHGSVPAQLRFEPGAARKQILEQRLILNLVFDLFRILIWALP